MGKAIWRVPTIIYYLFLTQTFTKSLRRAVYFQHWMPRWAPSVRWPAMEMMLICLQNAPLGDHYMTTVKVLGEVGVLSIIWSFQSTIHCSDNTLRFARICAYKMNKANDALTHKHADAWFRCHLQYLCPYWMYAGPQLNTHNGAHILCVP